MKKKNQILTVIQKNPKILILVTILLVIFHQYMLIIFLFAVFTMLGILSMKVTQVVPHISIETVSASAVIFGYIWGWKLGLAFGLVAGFTGIISISFVKLKAIINVMLMGLCGVVASIFASLDYTFTTAYMLTFVVRMVLNNVIFPLVESDVFENMIHGFGDPIFNMLITYQFMNIFHKIIMLII